MSLLRGRDGAPYEWAVAGHPRSGHDVSGDAALVTPRADGTLVAVVDGLGHGQPAAEAAQAAVATLRTHADEDVVDLVRRCHRALRHSRGAVLTVATAGDDGTLRWTGVGNVLAVVVRARPAPAGREHALALGGVAGMQLPRLRPGVTALQTGDMIVMATDGIRTDFVEELRVGPPQRIADDILRRHGSAGDDALVLVGRYRKGWA